MALPVETFFLHPDAQGTLQSQIQQMIAPEFAFSNGVARGWNRVERTPKFVSKLAQKKKGIKVSIADGEKRCAVKRGTKITNFNARPFGYLVFPSCG